MTRTDRPTPLSRVWAGDKVIAEDLNGEDLGDVLELHADAFAWWVLERESDPEHAQLRVLAKALDLDHLAVHDILADDHRAKFEEVGAARLVITNAAALDPDQAKLDACPVSLIVTDRILICLAVPTESFHPAKLLTQNAEHLATGGVEVALQVIMTAVITTYENVEHWLENSSDDLADALFEERPLSRTEQIWAFKLRTVLSRLRRLTDPMRAVVTDLVENVPASSRGPAARRSLIERKWTMIEEHHNRVANATDALREALSSVFDTSLALADVRMNTIMKKLTGWAAIVAVPTLVTSFVGMNVGFPGYGTVSGFWLYLAIMIISGVALYLVFRRQDWL